MKMDIEEHKQLQAPRGDNKKPEKALSQADFSKNPVISFSVQRAISSIHKGFHFMNTRFFYLNTDYLRSRFSPAPFLRTKKKQTLLLQRLFGGEEVIRSFASIAVPGISLRRMLLGLCRPLPLDFSPFSRPRRRSKSQAHASVARVRIDKKTDAAIATSV